MGAVNCEPVGFDGVASLVSILWEEGPGSLIRRGSRAFFRTRVDNKTDKVDLLDNGFDSEQDNCCTRLVRSAILGHTKKYRVSLECVEMTEDRGKPKRSITTSEIARLSGVSPLNRFGRTERQAQTFARVRGAKSSSAFGSRTTTPGMIAKTLVGELSRMVAVLAPNLGSPYHMMAFRGINEILVKQGYHLLFHSVSPEDQEDPETPRKPQGLLPGGLHHSPWRGGSARRTRA